MDVYGVSAPDLFRIDDLLDFSNDEIFSSSGSSSTTTATADSHHHHHHHHHSGNSSAAPSYYNALPNCSADFTDNLCVPSDDVAELEWLSNFVEDSFSDFPNNAFTGTMNINSNTSSFPGRSRSKRSRSISTNTSWNCSLQQPQHELQNPNSNSNSIVVKKEENNYSSSSQMEDVPRRCTHCASEKTPQWRTGPMGPKTLCNACGVRYKSGRLVPEYRPAASPTFVLTQHSNSHRKVMELRRQKEVGRQQSPPQTEEDGMYGRHFQVC